ncbi:uncharacterized protein LOC129583851 isoform X2 [Paramacrobiotus metropolitanus]|uniref:uncharacterized protein LOC129583851 isoform X2 n=1 Tax=Paramacrobiotus metropolitanus TaxID=2943436 RepID=UPI0024456461|nr:uncharacterized protein LOC129583851 isoform X2 [Paramacrobiotus metropolitanus]
MAAVEMHSFEAAYSAQMNGVDHKSNQFVQRVSHLPMVALSLSRLSDAYQKTKVRNALLKLVLEKGEETVWGSYNLASLIASKTGLQGPLNKVDMSACYLLSKVEEKLPVITYTPNELMDSTMRIYDDNVRPQIDRIAHIKDNTVQKYQDAKEFSAVKLSEAKHLGAATVKTVIDYPVNRVNQSVEWSLNTADSLVDMLLPEGDSDHVNMNNHPEVYDGNMDHARIISLKLRQRVVHRLADNAHTAALLDQALHIVESLKHSTAANSVNHVLDNIRRLSVASRTNGVHHQEGVDAHHVDDLSHSLLGQVQGYVASVQTTMNAALDVLTETYLLKWLIPEYKNIGSLEIHMQ